MNTIKDGDMVNAIVAVRVAIDTISHEYASLESYNTYISTNLEKLSDENEELRSQIEILTNQLKEASNALAEAYLTTRA